MNPVVLYEDNHLLVADKPAGLLTQADSTGHASLEDVVREYLRVSRRKEGGAFAHAAHRLDRDVSGIVLFALTSKALSRLNAQQRDGAWVKKYRAWVQGGPPQPSGTLVHWLAHVSHRAEVLAASDPSARECRLEYEVIRRERDRSLLGILLHTGRYHQIRAQLAAAGWPVLGDSKYGSTTDWRAGGIALRHTFLSLTHPVKQTELRFEAPSELY